MRFFLNLTVSQVTEHSVRDLAHSGSRKALQAIGLIQADFAE